MTDQPSQQSDGEPGTSGAPAALPRRIRTVSGHPKATSGTGFSPETLARLAKGVKDIPDAASAAVIVPNHHEPLRQLKALLTERPEGYIEQACSLIEAIATASAAPYEKVIALRGMLAAAHRAAQQDGNPATLVNLHLALTALKRQMPDGLKFAREELAKINPVLEAYPVEDPELFAELTAQIEVALKAVQSPS